MRAGTPTSDDSGASRPRRATAGGGASTASDSPRHAAGGVDPGLGSTLAWTVLGTLVPGLGLWRAGRRLAGSLIMGVVVLLIAAMAWSWTQREALVAWAAPRPEVLQGMALGLLVVAVGWVMVIGATHLALRPRGAGAGYRAAGAVLVGGLSFLVAVPLALGANVAYTSSQLVNTIFDNTDDDEPPSETVPTITNTVDPWAEKDRLNVLILGGDSGTGRSAKTGMRADTVIVASIETKHGYVNLFSLPRQTARMPFPRDSKLAEVFPHGWYNPGNPGDQNYWLSAMYNLAPPRVPKGTLSKTRHLPEDIMKISVGEALGLPIDYFVNVNMDGFKDVVNALGGVTLNVNSPIPIGGDTDRNILPTGWIEPGPDQKLGGGKALWYARGRWGYWDYSRMERQRCVINAVVDQATPLNVLANFQKIAAAGEKTVTTDIPDTMIAPLLTLADRVKGQTMRSIVFQHKVDGFSTTDPDWTTVRKQVKKALKEATKTNAKPTTDPTASPSGKPVTSAKPRSDDLKDECGYHPDGFIPKGYPGTRDNPMGYRQGKR